MPTWPHGKSIWAVKRLLADQLSTFHDSLRESNQRLAGLFERRFSGGLSVQAAERIAVAGMQTPALAWVLPC